MTRYHYTGDWSELSLVLGRPLEGLGRGAGRLKMRIEITIQKENCKTQVVLVRREIRAGC